MQISFGDDAFDAYVQAASGLREGYTVALLPDGEEPKPGEIERGVDVQFIRAHDQGVTFRELDRDGEPYGPELTRTWEHVARIHVY